MVTTTNLILGSEDVNEVNVLKNGLTLIIRKWILSSCQQKKFLDYKELIMNQMKNKVMIKKKG